MADRNRDTLKVDATAELTKTLDHRFQAQFPELSEKTESKEAFLNGDVAHVYLKIPKDWRTSQQFRSNLLTILQVANTSPLPYSEHGREHETYNETLSTLIQRVTEGTFVLRLQPLRKRVGSKGNIEVQTSRIVLESANAEERKTYRPVAHQIANEISKDENEKSRIKKLRQYTIKYGVGFGILVAAYLKPQATQILNLFANPDFRRTLAEMDYKKIPTQNRSQDIDMANDISRILQIKDAREIIPSPLPDKYKEVLEVLKRNRYLSEEDVRDESIFGFRQVSDLVVYKAFFVGSDEKAQELAPDDLKDPYRTEYITQKYSGMTSIIATAFIEPIGPAK